MDPGRSGATWDAGQRRTDSLALGFHGLGILVLSRENDFIWYLACHGQAQRLAKNMALRIVSTLVLVVFAKAMCGHGK